MHRIADCKYCEIYNTDKYGHTTIIPKKALELMSVNEFIHFITQEIQIFNMTDWFYYGLDNHRNAVLDDMTNGWYQLVRNFKDKKAHHQSTLTNWIKIIRTCISMSRSEYPHLPTFTKYLRLVKKQTGQFLHAQSNPNYQLLRKTIK